MKKIRFIVEAELPQAVHEHRVASALVDAVVAHVVPDYTAEKPRVTCDFEPAPKPPSRYQTIPRHPWL